MKKSDLKTGMRVKCRNGETAIIMIGDFDTIHYGKQTLFVCFSDGFTTGDSYSSNLLYPMNKKYDIIEVYASTSKIKPSSMLDPKTPGPMLWARKEEEPICTIDGIEYSESTLRSLIKKATQS